MALLLFPLLLLTACGGGGGGASTASPAASAQVSPTASPAASAQVSPTASPAASAQVSPAASPAASAEVSPTPSSAPVELPEGFPSDFPIYQRATITAARHIDAAQGSIFAVGMETTDSADTVRTFYEAKLAETPWEVSNVVEITQENTVVVEFARREGGEAGTVAIQQQQTDGQKTLITVSLPAPATLTPSPTP